jgi:prepilin-type N-terminal cleavage/methylation domain-containing protein
MNMRAALRQEHGFTLTELLFSTAITLVVLGTAMSTF